MGTFDAALMEALLSIGVSPERARSVVDSFDRSIDARYSLHAQILATERDLAEMETRLTREVGETRERIAAVDARVTESVASTNARIAETKSEILCWTLGALTAQTALLLSAIKLL
jgi:predicted  nucleic acid-binding Zn-ribbon protein